MAIPGDASVSTKPEDLATSPGPITKPGGSLPSGQHQGVVKTGEDGEDGPKAYYIHIEARPGEEDGVVQMLSDIRPMARAESVRQTNIRRPRSVVSGNPGLLTANRTRWLPDGKTDKLAVVNVGYARVSTTDQQPALQLDALAAAGCGKVFEDRASGAKADRTGLMAALSYVRDGDILIVWKLDRLGRSLPHLIETVTTLEGRGVGFRSITEAIDTTTPGGRLVFHLFGALGQFERDLIQERTRAGLVAAAVRGRRGGRKPVVLPEKLERARGMVAKGLTVREAATRLKVGKTSLYEALRGQDAQR